LLNNNENRYSVILQKKIASEPALSVGQGHKRGTGYECVEQGQGIRSAVPGRPINGAGIKKGAIRVRSKIARSRKDNDSPVAFVTIAHSTHGLKEERIGSLPLKSIPISSLP
jgi:hypothetical protein